MHSFLSKKNYLDVRKICTLLLLINLLPLFSFSQDVNPKVRLKFDTRFDFETWVPTNKDSNTVSSINGKYFNIIVDDSLDFEDAYSTLVQDGYVVNYIESANNMLWGEVELDTSSYAYKNDTLRVITIVLNYIN